MSGRRHILALVPLTVLAASPATATEQLPADVASGWDFEKSLKPDFKPWGYSVVDITDGHPVRAGRKSLRFEVRPGDCSWNTIGHNDCKTDRERHELVQVGDLQKEGDEYWYAWSLYLPQDYPVVSPVRVALAQFHQHPEVIWMFRNDEGGYAVNRQEELGRGYGYDPILRDEDMRGLWNDILVHASWTSKPEGRFTVWVNGVKAYDYTGPTMGKANTVYFKLGIYRTFVSHFRRKHGVAEVPRQVVYFDEIRRGRSRAEVAIGRD
ncbi:MAG: polysaccharide lyase [Pseudomonadota bacterium]|nr:polysaccharide lyase [Pseudomonadota bacterium]